MLRFFFTILTLLVVYASSFCNENGVDSLKRLIIHSVKDSFQVNLRLKISVFLNKRDPNESSNYAKEALKMAKQINYEKGIAEGYYMLGKNYMEMGLYEQAMENLTQTYNMYKSTNKLHEQGKIINTIGNVFWYNNDILLATDYYKELHLLSKKIKDKHLESIATMNIGMCYSKLKKPDSSLKYLNIASYNFTQLNDSYGISLSLLNIGAAYFLKNEFEKAIQHYKLIESRYLGYLPPRIKSSLYSNISEAYIAKNKIPKAVKYNKLSHTEAIKSNSLIAMENYYLHKTTLDTTLMDYKSAFFNHSRYLEVKDCLLNDKYRTKLASFRNLYELEKKENKIQLLEKENQLQNLKLKQSQSFYVSLFIIVILLLVVTIVFIRLGRFRSLSNKQLQEKNSELKEQKEELISRNEELIHLNTTKDKFFSIIAHDLLSPVASLNNLSESLLKELENISREEMKDCLKSLSESSEKVWKLLNELLEWGRSRTGTINFNPTNIVINDIISNVIFYLKPTADQKVISIHNNIKLNIEAFGDSNMVFTILRNLVTNAIKFSYPGGKIDIDAFSIGDFIKVQVMDNGIGISEHKKEKLFKIESAFTTVGTRKEKGTGLGLILCKDLIDKHTGQIGVNGKEDGGCNFWFTIPINEKVLRDATP